MGESKFSDSFHAGSHEAIVRWLSLPENHPQGAANVEVCETHLSWVFLTDRHAYKLKKPVRFEFVDFSTPDARRRACEDELRLNRRMAPDVYLQVLPISQAPTGELRFGEDGQVVDWVVQMRRLRAEDALDARLRAGALSHDELQSIAEFLANFYQQAHPLDWQDGEYPEAIARHVRANRAELLSPRHGLAPNLVKRVHAEQLYRLCTQSGQFSSRVAQRRLIDGHGDLRPEHVYLSPRGGEPPVVIDCLEFSPELRRLDITDELAFLAMECDALGAQHVGEEVLNAWQKASGDNPPGWLIHFYKAYRACVRAKVAALRADQLDATGRADARRQAERYLQLAEGYRCGHGRPLLLAIGGLMGSGKSTLARALADGLGIEHLQTDALRRELLGESKEPAAYGVGRYAPEAKARVYVELLRRAEALLDEGLSVVLDATFLTEDLRRQAMHVAQQRGAVGLLVWCQCPRETALERIARRRQQGGGSSEARPELYDRQAAEQEPLSDKLPNVEIDTTMELAEQLSRVFGKLAELRC